MKKLAVIFFLFVLILACKKEFNQSASSRSTTASSQTNQKSVATRPFKGQLQSSINMNASTPPMPCTGDLPGLALPEHFLAGSATHLGEMITQQSILDHLSCNLSVATMQLTTAVGGQLAASNGDLVYYTGTDVIDVTRLVTATGTSGALHGVWTITGGTGRFEGATGSLTIDGVVDFITNTFSASANGTITY